MKLRMIQRMKVITQIFYIHFLKIERIINLLYFKFRFIAATKKIFNAPRLTNLLHGIVFCILNTFSLQ